MATTTAAPTLPTWEEYQAADRLTLFIDEEVEPLVAAIGRVINYEGEQKVDFADLGRLSTAIGYLGTAKIELNSVIARLKSTFVDLEAIRVEGRAAHEPYINERGTWNPGCRPADA